MKKDSVDIKMLESMKINSNKLIDENKELKIALKKMEKENEKIYRKYKALKNSKLGNLTLKFWDIKRKFR